jgi:hypothetical protein
MLQKKPQPNQALKRSPNVLEPGPRGEKRKGLKMNEEAFVAYVLNNAPRYELEALEKIISGLSDNIASRRWGKPADLKVGSKVEATMFDVPYVQYGEVVSMTAKSCMIETPGSNYPRRLWYSKYAIRILDEFEWNRVALNFSDRDKEYEAGRAAKIRERTADREDAIRQRDKATLKPRAMQALNGTVDIFRGAYVHAYRPDHGTHEYGVVVDMTPKRITLSSCESEWESGVWTAKCEIRLLSDEQWTVVDAELGRRSLEYEIAKKAGKEHTLPDYSAIEIVFTSSSTLLA